MNRPDWNTPKKSSPESLSVARDRSVSARREYELAAADPLNPLLRALGTVLDTSRPTSGLSRTELTKYISRATLVTTSSKK